MTTRRPSFFAPEHGAAFDRDCPIVLDLGAGTGLIARAIAPRAASVDAIDPSEAMLAEDRRLDGASHPSPRWLAGHAEDVALDPPYGLATAGSSLHWMDWDTVLPRLARTLTKKALFAMLDVDDSQAPWHEASSRVVACSASLDANAPRCSSLARARIGTDRGKAFDEEIRGIVVLDRDGVRPDHRGRGGVGKTPDCALTQSSEATSR